MRHQTLTTPEAYSTVYGTMRTTIKLHVNTSYVDTAALTDTEIRMQSTAHGFKHIKRCFSVPVVKLFATIPRSMTFTLDKRAPGKACSRQQQTKHKQCITDQSATTPSIAVGAPHHGIDPVINDVAIGVPLFMGGISSLLGRALRSCHLTA